MNENLKNIRFNFKIWLETSEQKGILGDGKLILLKTIHQTGSLKEAMKKLNWTYRKTWNNIKKIEELLGVEIFERKRGGNKGGGQTILTPAGLKIIEVFEKFHSQYDSQISNILDSFLLELRNNL